MQNEADPSLGPLYATSVLSAHVSRLHCLLKGLDHFILISHLTDVFGTTATGVQGDLVDQICNVFFSDNFFAQISCTYYLSTHGCVDSAIAPYSLIKLLCPRA